MGINAKISLKCVLVNKEDQTILALKRSEDDDSRPGVWDICGGSLNRSDLPTEDTIGVGDKNDLLFTGVRREIYEETGLKPDSLKIVHVASGYKSEKDRFLIGIAFIGYISKPGEVELSDEHSEAHWLKYEDFIKLDFGDSWASRVIKIIADKAYS